MGLLTDIISEKIRNTHQKELAGIQAKRAMQEMLLNTYMANSGTTGLEDPRIQWVYNDYMKGLTPEAKQTAQRGFDLIHKIKGALVGNNTQQPAQGSTPGQTSQSDNSGTGASPIPAPTAPLGSDKPPNPNGMAAPAAAALAADSQQGAAGPVSQPPQQPFSITDQAKQAQSFRQGPPPAAQDAAASAPATSATDAASAPAPAAAFRAEPQQQPLGQFDTKLSPQDEQSFQAWKAKYAPNDSGADYDLRGAFKSGLTPDPQTGHWPDTFKKPNHPTFSDQSQYAKDAPDKAGHWQGNTYIPPAATASAKQSFNQGALFRNPDGSMNVAAGLTGVDQAKLQHQLQLKQQQDAYYEAEAHRLLGPNANPRDVARFVGTQGKELPTFIRPTTAASNHAQLTESMRLANNLPDTEEGHNQAEELAAAEEVRQAKAKGLAVQQTKWFSYPRDKPGDAPHAVSVDPKFPDRRQDASTNKPIPEGATEVNPSLIEAQIRQNSFGEFGNLYKALKGKGYSDADAQRLAGEQVEAEYQRRLSLMGAGRIHEAMGVDENNHPITIPLRSTPVPNATAPIPPTISGGQNSPVPAPPPSGSQAGGGPAQSAPIPKVAPATKTAAQSTPAATNPVKVPGSLLAPRMLPGVSPSTARIAAQYSVPITESIVQMFGDEAKTGVKPLVAFAHLADDPAASARLGRAINLTKASLGDGIADASIGGGVGGIHASSGGFGTWLQNKLGVPGAVAEQNAGMLRDALSALTPEERQAYDATMSEMSVMAGLRSISKSSAAISNIRLIENEIPKLGTAASSAQYLDQMQRIGNAMRNAVHTPGLFPMIHDPQTGKDKPVGISADIIKQLDDLPNTINELKKGSGPAKAPPSKSTTETTKAQYDKLPVGTTYTKGGVQFTKK